MRNLYIIAYDICLPKRYRRVHRAMKGAGERIQYSIFRCPLSKVELHDLKEKIWGVLNFAEDRVIIINLGPVDGEAEKRIEYWGDTCEPLVRQEMMIF